MEVKSVAFWLKRLRLRSLILLGKVLWLPSLALPSSVRMGDAGGIIFQEIRGRVAYHYFSEVRVTVYV